MSHRRLARDRTAGRDVAASLDQGEHVVEDLASDVVKVSVGVVGQGLLELVVVVLVLGDELCCRRSSRDTNLVIDALVRAEGLDPAVLGPI
jgi:hypothetical protein